MHDPMVVVFDVHAPVPVPSWSFKDAPRWGVRRRRFTGPEGRAIVLRFWPDGTVTWQLRGRGGEVLEPAGRELAAMLKEEG